MDDLQLLAHVEDLIRTAPPRSTVRHETPENLSWLGRAIAVVSRWDGLKGVSAQSHVDHLRGRFADPSSSSYASLLTLLHQMRHALLMEAGAASGAAISQGMEFEYFDEIRKKLEEAQQEILFIDPYLDAEFVSRYLVHLRSGVEARLLTSRRKLSSLLPAAKLIAQQNDFPISVRTAEGLHDRYFFVDRQSCYQSGASFKDGAKNAPTTITQITDVFEAVWHQYEAIWSSAESHSI